MAALQGRHLEGSDDLDAELGAVVLIGGEGVGGLMAEAVVVAHEEGRGVELALEDALHEELGAHGCHLGGEMEDCHIVDGLAAEEVELLLEGGEQSHGGLGPEGGGGMAAEGDDHGLGMALEGRLPDLLQEVLMAEMEAVEASNGLHDGLVEGSGAYVTDYFHSLDS